jgi:hypothetical protein
MSSDTAENGKSHNDNSLLGNGEATKSPKEYEQVIENYKSTLAKLKMAYDSMKNQLKERVTLIC